MRFDANWTSSLISTNVVDVIISLTIKTLLDSTFINKQLAWNLRIFMQKFVFYQTINLFNAMNLHNQRSQIFCLWWRFLIRLFLQFVNSNARFYFVFQCVEWFFINCLFAHRSFAFHKSIFRRFSTLHTLMK